MPPKKSIFRQPGSKHFQLVHRSQRDPLIHDSEASPHVLLPFERENTKKGKSRTDLEHLLLPSDIDYDKKYNVGEAALYGIYYDDTKYDYMQHLRPVGLQEDGVESVLIEAPLPRKKKDKFNAGLDLPQEALPSTSELPRNYESQQAVPESIAGFQPDMDPHLRQVLEALEDNAFVDDGLDDDFFGELISGGERTGADDLEFEFDEYGIEKMGEKEDRYGADEGKGSSGQLDWEDDFALFKKNRGKEANSDDEFASEAGDTIEGLPTISVIGGKGKRRRKGSSSVSDYSMSSSSMYRNQALQTLDERFEQIMEKEYDEDGGEGALSDGDSSPSLDEAPELITSREDFDAIVNEFLHDYEILGRKMKPRLEGETGTQKLDTIRRALGQSHITHANEESDDDVQGVMALETNLKEDRWDCETILTRYSNLENHPHIICVSSLKPTPKISVDPNTGFPLVNGLPSKGVGKAHSACLVEDNSGTENTSHNRSTISRPRNESKETKKARKLAAKTERQSRRATKRIIKERFEMELQNQKQALTKSAPRVQKL